MVITRTVWPPPSMVDAIMPTLDQAFNNHKLLSEKIREYADFSPVPRALFSHNTYVYERMTDIKTIVTRLLEARHGVSIHLWKPALRSLGNCRSLFGWQGAAGRYKFFQISR